MSTVTKFLLALVVLAARLATAQPYLVKDVNSRILGTDSSPDPYASIGNVTLFAASSPAQGRELWRTDGTPAGTYLVRDLWEGPKSGLPVSSFYRDAIEGRVYFLGITAEHGRELWVTDGTTAGTKMVADIWPGPAGSFPTAPIATASGNYFVASGETTGFELWKTDGTAAGTKLVVDLNPGITSPSPHILGAVGSRIVFHANDGTRTGLFISDGTAQGTQFIATSAEVLLNTSLNDAIVYTVIAGATRTLMRTDGTAAGTIVLREGFTRIGQSGFTVAGAHAYFFTNHDGAPSEIWRTDGTAAGTQLVTTIAQRASDMEIVAMARLGDRILFSTSGTLGQYWVTDGTAAGTSVIKDAPHNNGEIAVTGAKAYFTASDAAHGSEPWITDGTIEGTRLFADVVVGSAGSDASEFASVGGGVMFAAKSGTTGREPWFADGTEAGTRMLKNVAADHISDSNPRELRNVNGTLSFIADDGFGDTVWTTDGTPYGTTRIALPPEAGNVQTFDEGDSSAVTGGLYYFLAGQPHNTDLWRTDGTKAGTFRLSDNDGTLLLPYRNGLLFFGHDAAHGRELWFTDGTASGTRLFMDVTTGPQNSAPFRPTVVDDVLYFSSGHYNRRTTDGTPANTTFFAEGISFPNDSPFVILDEWLYRPDPFVSRVHLRVPKYESVQRFDQKPLRLHVFGSSLLIFLDRALWRSYGTQESTSLIKTLPAGSCVGESEIAVTNGVLYWTIVNAQEGSVELWRTNGTSAGTALVESISDPSATCRSLFAADGRVYFMGTDAFHGNEVWVSDGTETGTHLLYDVNSGPDSSDPREFFTIGDTLYFTATTPNAGRELWTSAPFTCVTDCIPKRRAARK